MEPGQEPKARDYFTAYSQVSCIQGLKHLGEKNRSPIERVFWAIVVLFCLCMCLYLILKITETYRNQPFITSFDQRTTPLYEIPVPAITICPKPAIDVTKFNICEYMDKIHNGESLTEEEKLIYDILALTSDPTKPSSKRFFKFQEIHTFLNKAKNNIFSRSTCNWYRGRMNCAENWIPILTDMGVCYTFNMINLEEIYRPDVVKPNVNNGIRNVLKVKGYDIETSRFNKKAGLETYPRRMWRAGATFALVIMINSPAKLVEPNCSSDRAIGFKILLHNPAQIPTLKSESLPVGIKSKFMINFEPQIVVTGEKLKSYPPEERECYFSQEKRLRYFNNYTEENCELECMTNLTLKECGCVSFYMPHTNKTAICGLGKARCTKRILWSRFMDSSLANNCLCLPSCHSVNYNADMYHTNLIEKDKHKNKFVTKISFFSVTREVRAITKYKLYTMVKFVAHFGGLLGLFLNFSCVCLIELLYYLTIRLYYNYKLYGNKWAK